jgi:hypothetical protein
MADGVIILTDDTSNLGKPLDHEIVTYGTAPVSRYRPRVVIGGAAAAVLVAPVNAQPTNQYGLPVWVQGFPNAVVAAQMDDAATVVAVEDGFANLRVTAQRSLHVHLRDAAGVEVFPRAAIGDTDANPTAAQIEAFGMVYNGATWERRRSGAQYSTTGLGVQLVNPNGMQRRTYVSGPVISPAAFVAATAKDIWSIFHAASVVPVARLRRIVISIYSNTVAGSIRFELFRITAAGTNTAHVPTPTDAADAAASCTIGIAHTGATTVTGNALAQQSPGALTTTPTVPPILFYDWQESGETKAPLMRASTGEGYAIRATHSAASTVVFGVQATFTEEP